MSEQRLQPPSTDILRLFREDINPKERVDAFVQAGKQLEDELETLATPENIAAINDNFGLTLVLNSHGDGVNAGQSLREVQRPFITFVENAGDRDLAPGPQGSLFGLSLFNAFGVQFNHAEPFVPSFPATEEGLWQYWRERGLLAKGSIIMPIDIRHYTKRLLDALMGDDYDQSYLNSGISIDDLRLKEYGQLVQEQIQKGLLVKHSNAVRELTSTKQVLQTLLLCIDPRSHGFVLDGDSIDKLNALRNKQLEQGEGKLPAYILYGTAHHSIYHVFRRYGINISRTFPSASDLPGNLKYTGVTKDQFFSSHPYKLPEGADEKYAKQHILESLLWCPMSYRAEYGLVPDSRATTGLLWLQIARIARKPELVGKLDSILEEFKNDKSIPTRILRDNGIYLRSIAE